MGNWLSYFVKKTATKEVTFTSLGIIISILIIRSLGLLQSLEWTAYDFLFFLRPNESIEERIVIVAWDEADLQITEEGTMSDNTLATVLSQIKVQNPRFIGLDIYRDLPVTSKLLSDSQNNRAYKKLTEIFQTTPNLVGIEKVLIPPINPPKILKEKGQTTAADLVTDRDGTVRRVYLYPLEDENGYPAEPPSLGMVLGYQYLAHEGWQVAEIEEADNFTLSINKPDQRYQVILESLPLMAGGYMDTKEDGTKILVNWRKGERRFSQVFVSEVASGNIPPDIFTDKIVLIGNTSASGSDKHYLPINRWSKIATTNGVEIHAQIASSIINAALDKRPLIKVIPKWNEWIILMGTVLGITLIAEKYRSKIPLQLCLITIGSAVVIIIGLNISAFIAFEFGYWIPIVPSLLGAIVTPLVVCLTIYINKINAANQDFKRLLKDLDHSLSNPIGNTIKKAKLAQHIADLLVKGDKEGIEKIEKLFHKNALSSLKQNIDSIVLQSERINYLRDNAQKYFAVAYLGEEIFKKTPTDINNLVQKTVSRTVKLKKLEYNFSPKIQEKYDKNVDSIEVAPKAIERTIENLIDNAFYAIAAKNHKPETEQGVILIETKSCGNKIEIAIEDNGTGIAASLINQIFLPYKSNKARGQGQGLGLSIAKETLLHHNGAIEVESQEGQGSKFILVLNK